MIGIWLLLLVALLQGSGDGAATVGELFESGRSWQQFLTGVSAQRELWLKTESAVTIRSICSSAWHLQTRRGACRT
jgi:hypothetical protein